MRTVRFIFWLVLIGLFLLAPLGANNHIDELVGIGLGGCVIWWFCGMMFSRWIGAALISSIRCKGCGLEIPAVGKWQVGSYTDHRERHYMLAKNPIDGSRIGHTTCPQCSATILL